MRFHNNIFYASKTHLNNLFHILWLVVTESNFHEPLNLSSSTNKRLVIVARKACKLSYFSSQGFFSLFHDAHKRLVGIKNNHE